MDTETRVQILDKADCISHISNTLGKGMNPISLTPGIDKQEGRLAFLSLLKQPIYEKENSHFNPVKLDVVPDSAHVQRLVNTYMYRRGLLIDSPFDK